MKTVDGEWKLETIGTGEAVRSARYPLNGNANIESLAAEVDVAAPQRNKGPYVSQAPKYCSHLLPATTTTPYQALHDAQFHSDSKRSIHNVQAVCNSHISCHHFSMSRRT